MEYFTLFAPRVTLFHYLFTLVNGSQGAILLFIVIFRTVRANPQRRTSYKAGRQKPDDLDDDFFHFCKPNTGAIYTVAAFPSIHERVTVHQNQSKKAAIRPNKALAASFHPDSADSIH